MKVIALFLTYLALAAATVEWDDLRVKWLSETDDPDHTDSFYQMPRTVEQAVNKSWVEVPGINSTWVTIYCLQGDPNVCLLFDSRGVIAGIQIGMLVSDLESVQSVYNMSRIGEYKIKTIFGYEVWTLTAFFQDPKDIANGGRCAEGEWDGLTGVSDVWFETYNGEGFVMGPRNRSDLPSINYKWSSSDVCVARMGTHTYHDMSANMSCADIEPWFLMYDNGTLSGIGFQQFGNASSLGQQTLFEVIDSPSFEAAAYPLGPDCLYDNIDTLGMSALHIQMGKEPWNLCA